MSDLANTLAALRASAERDLEMVDGAKRVYRPHELGRSAHTVLRLTKALEIALMQRDAYVKQAIEMDSGKEYAAVLCPNYDAEILAALSGER